MAMLAVALGALLAPATVRSASPPWDNTIGAFADLEGSNCNIPAPMSFQSHMYLLALDRSGSGGAGFEFRLEGFPEEWWRVITPNSESTVAIGNPLAEGCNIAFLSCQTGGAIRLYTVDFVASTPVVNQELRTSVPQWCDFRCDGPLWVLCDAPVFTQVNLASFTSYLNAPENPCVVSVETTTWSRVRNLFR